MVTQFVYVRYGTYLPTYLGTVRYVRVPTVSANYLAEEAFIASFLKNAMDPDPLY